MDMQTQKKCLVTGATGFVGTNLVHELVKTGWDVRASGMHGSVTKYIADLPIEIVLADITKSEEVDGIVEGCDVVFHVAGDTSFWRRHRERQAKINIDGTMNIARACHKYGVRRLVHTSTLDVLGYRTNDELITETNGDFNFDKMGYYYGETKLEGERQLRAFCQEAELDYVVIYPGFMIGPFDYTLQLGSLFFDLINDELPGYIIGGGSFCHVTEVAKAHVEAAIRGRSGEGYICAGAPHTNMTHKALWQKMGAAVGAKPLTLTLPRWGFLAYAYLSEFVATFTQKKPAINPGMARYMMVGQYASSKKAEQELGYRIPTIDECIRDALSWYRTHGFMTG